MKRLICCAVLALGVMAVEARGQTKHMHPCSSETRVGETCYVGSMVWRREAGSDGQISMAVPDAEERKRELEEEKYGPLGGCFSNDGHVCGCVETTLGAMPDCYDYKDGHWVHLDGMWIAKEKP